MVQPGSPRLRRLAEELDEGGLRPIGSDDFWEMLVEEVDYALRPSVHEGRVPSTGSILDPKADPVLWAPGTQLDMARIPVVDESLADSRRFVDGLSSWLLRRTDGNGDEWLLFDRPAGSERDLVVLADVMDATIVQRHPTGFVRVVGSFGVLRWEGLVWHHEPPVATWVVSVVGIETPGAELAGDPTVVEAMLQLAVHDLGSRGIGALLVYRPGPEPGPAVEARLPTPPPLHIRTASHLAPLRHPLAHVDGAAFFDADGVLRQLGVRLIPSIAAERSVEAHGGTRHISGLRYSHDDPTAIVVVVSEDGPVSVLRHGSLIQRPPPVHR